MRFCDGVYVSDVYVWVRVRVCRRFTRSKLTWVLFYDSVYMSGVYVWVCVRVCRRCKLTWVLFYDGVYVLGVYVWVCVWVCRRFVRSRLTWVRRTFCSTSASLWTAAFSCQTLWTRSQWPPTRTTSSRKTSRNSVSFSEDLREIMRCSMKTLRRNFALFSEILVKFCVVQWKFKKLCLFSDTLACRVGVTRQAKYLAGKMWISVLARHDENTRWNFDKLIAELFVGFGQLLLVFLCLVCSSITDVFMNEWYIHLWFIAADEFSISSQYSSPSCMYTRNRQDWL